MVKTISFISGLVAASLVVASSAETVSPAADLRVAFGNDLRRVVSAYLKLGRNI
jgi:hypothetical protein